MLKLKEGTVDYEYMVKILVIGDSAVGKTSFLSKFCKGKLPNTHIATMGFDLKTKTIEVKGKRIKLQIWDTAGQERYRSIVQTYYKGAAGVILAYAVNDRSSFRNVEKWMKQIESDAIENVAVVLIGNKCDLTEREVEMTEGQRLADKYGIKFFETSAKNGTNVDETIFELGKGD